MNDHKKYSAPTSMGLIQKLANIKKQEWSKTTNGTQLSGEGEYT